MKDWTEQLLTLCATLAVVCVFVVGVHLPRQRALTQLRKQVGILEQNLTLTQQRCAVLIPLTQQVDQLRAAAPRFQEHLPADIQVGSFLRQVAEHLRLSQLASLEMRPSAPVQAVRYAEQPIRLGFEGRFSNVFAFLAELESLTRVKRIVRLDLSSETGQEGSVRANLLLSIYSAKG